MSWGVVDYAKWDGDPELLELVQPIFKKKRLVLWNIDYHVGPVSDVRLLLEPLGVEFIEHVFYHPCIHFCTCEHFAGMTLFEFELLTRPANALYKHIYNDPIAASDITRTMGSAAGGAGGAAAPPRFWRKIFQYIPPPPRFWRVL